MFIAAHQIAELWLKMLLRDLVAARDLFALPHVPDDALAGASRLLKRATLVVEMATEHFKLLKTMTPRDYLEFRDKLFPANGGQSPQFREIEVLLGLGEDVRIPYVASGGYLDVLREADGSEGPALRRVLARLEGGPTVRETIDAWLFRTPINGSIPTNAEDQEVVEGFIEEYLEGHQRSLEALADHVATLAPSDEREALRSRYEAQATDAAAFQRAEDVTEGSARIRRRRIRAAILYIEAYRGLPLLAWPREIVDGLVALEQAFVIFRQRHARMAERIIGRRVGTGGSTGVGYLDRVAITYRVFEDLWAVRSLLMKRECLPPARRADLYRFTFGSPSPAP